MSQVSIEASRLWHCVDDVMGARGDLHKLLGDLDEAREDLAGYWRGATAQRFAKVVGGVLDAGDALVRRLGELQDGLAGAHNMLTAADEGVAAEVERFRAILDQG